MKSGYVAIIGRTNAGKSTLINSIIGTKVAITSPKPKTTRFSIQAVYEDERGQIIFTDTPGLSEQAIKERVTVVVYIIDQTRQRGGEENKVIGLLRKFENKPKILVFNKIDSPKKSYKAQYLFLESEVDKVVEVSARENLHVKNLIDTIFEYLPEGEPLVDTKDMITPLLNVDSDTFIAELVREKIYLFTKEEVPYQTSISIDEIANRKNGTLYVRATIFVTKERYKKMLIGESGRKIKQIGTVTRKELSAATNRKVYVELHVETRE